MKITIIAAVDRNMGIGYKNDLLVYNKEDLQHFKALTYGYPVLMGRKTFASLPTPCLEGRHLIVVSTSEDIVGTLSDGNGVNSYTSKFLVDAAQLRSAIETFENFNYDTLWVAGGAQVYEYYLKYNLADEIVLTQFNVAAENVDKYFPDIPQAYRIYKTTIIQDGIIYYFKKTLQSK